MNFTFMIPLTIFIVATYFVKKSSDEIVYLCGLIAIVGLLLSLILAPWQIQLFLLVIAGLSTLKLRQPNQTVLEIEPTNKLSLLYRGSNYEHSSVSNNHEVAETDLTGKYRGQVWQNHHSEAAKIPQIFHLRYRGANLDCQKYVAPSDREKTVIQVKVDINSATPINHQT
ncbi:DUF4278 domain-containing protein [Aerosakkonemataceae cyanobacterium BLCC-F154]|uniref:DUF4278 domain-containing protein n=1 Tax=Floridaenema fluviatile BLCC-F154 TaxID=3153640 RepID=A0ABV4YE16_9CYAN